MFTFKTIYLLVFGKKNVIVTYIYIHICYQDLITFVHQQAAMLQKQSEVIEHLRQENQVKKYYVLREINE